MAEGTDMNQIEKVARAIIGPHEPVPASSRYTLDELREVRWRQITSDERSMALREAKAAIAAWNARASDAEITRLTEALRARVDAAYSALRVAAAHVDALAERIRDTAPWYIRRAVESEAKTLEGAAVMIRAIDPAKIVEEG